MIFSYPVSLVNNMTDLVKVTRSEAMPAAEALAKAFAEYPMLKYYYPERKKREKITRYFFAGAVYSGIRFGEVYATSDNMEGDILRSTPLSVTAGLFKHGVYKMKTVGDFIDSVKSRLAPPKHMFLQTIGVVPENSGKGFAGKLIRPLLLRLDKEKLPCYLETLDGSNVGLYEHFGFKLIEESIIPGTELTNWAMLR